MHRGTKVVLKTDLTWEELVGKRSGYMGNRVVVPSGTYGTVVDTTQPGWPVVMFDNGQQWTVKESLLEETNA